MTKDEKIRNFYLRAEEALDSSENDLQHDWHISSVNRAYYSIFYGLCALLLTKGIESGLTHAGTITQFNLHFIKTAEIPSEYSKMISQVYQMRLHGDYDISYNLEDEDVEKTFSLAKDFFEMVKEKLEGYYL